MKYDELKEHIIDILKDKRFQWIATAIIFLIVLFMSSSIRLSNWDLLTDQTTGEKIPLALDPFYFLRIAETIVESNGTLPEFDAMRHSTTGTPWHSEIMPKIVVGMYNLGSVFNPELTLREVNVFSPVAFYFIGLIIFFFLVYVLTKSKIVGLISSGLLAFSPAYLYRTMAGFSDHESIGMIAVFACLLIYTFALKNFEKDWKKTILYGLGTGFFTALVLATWGGAITLVLMVIPFSFLLYWLLKNGDRVKAIVFYLVWIISSIVFPAVFSNSLVRGMISKFSSTYGLMVFAVLGFILIDYIFELLIKIKRIKIKKENKILWTFGSLIVLGSIALTFLGKNIFGVLKDVWHAILFPFGTGRLGLTVAENAQPYLMDWINQNGSIIFWLFVFGIFLIGIELGKIIRSKKHSMLFSLSWMLMISCMLFSRISSQSILNGENILSQGIYLMGVGIFLVYFVWLKKHNEFEEGKLDVYTILLTTLMFIVVLNGRSAVRTFFLITPFVLLSVGYFVMKIFEYAQRSKDEILKIVLWGLFLFALGGMLLSMNTYKENITNQAKYTGPSANAHWQEAMSWVRENTDEASIFAHWWDYGYWVQTLGERATIADGGHFQGFYSGNRRIGRYILTTDKPPSAYSFMKSHNVSYLLIDPTDLGKYSAYSKIGSDDNWDRFSMIPVGVSNEKNVQETADGVTQVYQFNSIVDEDIYYDNIFLPGPSYDAYGRPSYKSYIIGVLLKVNSEDNGTIEQPEAVYIYNNIQYRIPLRRVYFNGQLYDFGNGLNATIRLIPAVQQSGQGMTISPFGAAIYLSPRTEKTLFAKLYLMNDPLDEYKDISSVHSEDAPVVKAIKAQGAAVNDFIYYQGFRGPIKIWKINYPISTPVYEEFLKSQTGHADMDWRFE